MEMVGGGRMQEYPVQDEGPHSPGPETNWQESVVLIWWDPKNDVGGYCRIGHEPNLNGGEAVMWTSVTTPDQVFHRTEAVKLDAGDRSNDHMSAGGGASNFHYDGQCVWHLKEPDLDLNLRLEDFHPAIDGYLKDGERQLAKVHSNHVEVACRVTGTLIAKGRQYDIDGLGVRDHGWGSRNWGSIWAHRWNVGAFDRDNSFCALSMHLSDDTIAKFGWVVRGDKVIYADRVEIVAYMANDGATNVGGRTLMTLSTGEKFEVHLDPVAPGAMFNRHGICCVDTLSRITWGDKVGYGVFESSSNLQAGQRIPQVLDTGIASNGWHRNPMKKA